MEDKLNKEQAKKDLLFLALKIANAHRELNEAYSRIKELYEGID